MIEITNDHKEKKQSFKAYYYSDSLKDKDEGYYDMQFTGYGRNENDAKQVIKTQMITAMKRLKNAIDEAGYIED